jgi:hypothetical protein
MKQMRTQLKNALIILILFRLCIIIEAYGSDFANLLPESKDIKIATKLSEYCESERTYKKGLSHLETNLYIEFLSKETAVYFIQCFDGPWNKHVPKFAMISMMKIGKAPWWGGPLQLGIGDWHPTFAILYDKDGDDIPLLNPQNSGGGVLFSFTYKSGKQFPWQDKRIYDRLDNLYKECR